MSKGIDVSYHNGTINWDAVSGVDFAILRAGFGKELSQKDKQFERNYSECKRVGIPVGCYHYSYAKNMTELQQELNCFLQWIAGKTFEFPIYFDWEENYIPDDYVVWFCDQLESRGYFSGVYANTNFMTNKTSGGKLDSLTLWLADYRANYNKTLPRDIHQYTSGGSVSGISGRVDMNNCTRDFEAEIKAAGKNGFSAGDNSSNDNSTAPSPTPAPSANTVNIAYRARTKAHGWLPEVGNLDSYAGYQESPITDLSMRVSDGTVQYRVHVLGGGWLPVVTGANINDAKNGYAGSGKPIDAVEVYYETPSNIRPFKRAKYRVAPCNGDYFSWQYDKETSDGQDGYAGTFGKEIGSFQICIE